MSALDTIPESLDWQFKIAMYSDKDLELWRRQDCRARLLEIEEQLEKWKRPYRPWFKWASRPPLPPARPPPCPSLPYLPGRLPNRSFISSSDGPLPLRSQPPPQSLELKPSTASEIEEWRKAVLGHDCTSEENEEN